MIPILLISKVINALVALVVFYTFGTSVSDLFVSDYPDTMVWANIVRLLLTFVMLLGVPINFPPLRFACIDMCRFWFRKKPEVTGEENGEKGQMEMVGMEDEKSKNAEKQQTSRKSMQASLLANEREIKHHNAQNDDLHSQAASTENFSTHSPTTAITTSTGASCPDTDYLRGPMSWSERLFSTSLLLISAIVTAKYLSDVMLFVDYLGMSCALAIMVAFPAFLSQEILLSEEGSNHSGYLTTGQKRVSYNTLCRRE
jgi:hypothetical protein